MAPVPAAISAILNGWEFPLPPLRELFLFLFLPGEDCCCCCRVGVDDVACDINALNASNCNPNDCTPAADSGLRSDPSISNVVDCPPATLTVTDVGFLLGGGGGPNGTAFT